MELDLVWNIIITLIIMPFAWAFNKMFAEVKPQIDTHEAVCAERWKETILRIKRIEAIMIGTAGTMILMMAGLLLR